MGAKRTSVYLIDKTLEILGRGESLSARINQAVAWYDELIKFAMPELSRGEWGAIFDANNGSAALLYEGQSWESVFTGAWANIADSPGLGEKWEIDQSELVVKLRVLEPASRIAVLEAIETFWSMADTDTDTSIHLATRGRKMEPDPIAASH